jgi:hypothetical protein
MSAYVFSFFRRLQNSFNAQQCWSRFASTPTTLCRTDDPLGFWLQWFSYRSISSVFALSLTGSAHRITHSLSQNIRCSRCIRSTGLWQSTGLPTRVLFYGHNSGLFSTPSTGRSRSLHQTKPPLHANFPKSKQLYEPLPRCHRRSTSCWHQAPFPLGIARNQIFRAWNRTRAFGHPQSYSLF